MVARWVGVAQEEGLFMIRRLSESDAAVLQILLICYPETHATTSVPYIEATFSAE